MAAIRALPPTEQGKEGGAVYQVEVDADQSTWITVYQGEVGVTPPSKPSWGSPRQISGPPRQVDLATWNRLVDEILLQERQRMLVKADGSTEQESISEKEEAEDDWVQWNRERDRALGLTPGEVKEGKGVRSKE